MAATTLSELITNQKTPKDRIVLDIEIAAKISENSFKIKDPSLGDDVIDLQVPIESMNKFSKLLHEGNRVRLMSVGVDNKERKISILDKTRIFQLKPQTGKNFDILIRNLTEIHLKFL